MHKHRVDKLFCCICKSPVAEDRILRQAVTCSKDCANTLKNIRRRKRDQKKCRYCNAPSTPDERKLFKQWIATLGNRPKRGRPPLPKPMPQAEFTEMIHVP